ncbi:MAG: PA2779 family protein [Desulfobacterales bacterium]
MRRIRRNEKGVSILMVLLMVMISAPVSSVFAAMVGTEAIMSVPGTSGARDQVRSLLNRPDVRAQLVARGIDPAEAKARVDSLSDAEVMHLADKIDQLPTGGDFWGTLLFVSIIVFITLLVLEILGYTDFI